MSKTIREELIDMEAQVRLARWHEGQESRYMTHSNGWVMVRRPGCVPYTIYLRDWLALPAASEGRRLAEQYNRAFSAASLPTAGDGKGGVE